MYELGSLSDLHSQSLFHKRIFGSKDNCPDILEEVSNEILKKCGGLPLAIISISSLLANRSATKHEWEKVKRSIGSALENNHSLEGMNSILCLSYNDLPPNLKTCLLYLSVFPEDYVIYRERLVRRWIAEGFISEVRGQSQQEVAENYFYELINKSMVQPAYIDYDGKARACRVHDMMLEIIISKSAEENFITVVGGGQSSLANRQGFIRRLSIQYIDQELAFSLANEDLSHVRSLTIIPSCCSKHLPSLVQFEALRVLDLQGCLDLDDSYTNGMDKLYQLKYLNLGGTRVSKLPSRIELLFNLETLIIWHTQVRDLPAGFVQLAKLQHLMGVHDLPNGIGVMRKLQLMSGFNVYSSSKDVLVDLGNFTSLEELQVFVVMHSYCGEVPPPELRRREEAFLSSLCKLGTYKLRDLNINADPASLEFLDSWSPPPSCLQKFTASMMDSFTNFPKWVTPALTNLVDLDIALTELTEDDLLTLGKLPSLLRLVIKLSEKYIKVRVQGFSFPSLKVFDLANIPGAYVTFLKGSMPKLENLEIRLSVLMAKTDGFFLGIEHLARLKQAKIWLMRDAATISETKALTAAIRSEAGAHHNHVAVIFVGEPSEEDSDSEKSTEDDRTDGN
uniref:Uncharacterized protein n=1 Tax=Avena sativa TaxID=4498 RepID=A0ACD6AC41_AVESA